MRKQYDKVRFLHCRIESRCVQNRLRAVHVRKADRAERVAKRIRLAVVQQFQLAFAETRIERRTVGFGDAVPLLRIRMHRRVRRIEVPDAER